MVGCSPTELGLPTRSPRATGWCSRRTRAEMVINGQELLILREEEILAVVE